MYSSGHQLNFDRFFGPDCLSLGQETWRLFVDGKQQTVSDNSKDYGWVFFEQREPGCLHGMFQALAAQRKRIDEDVSLELVCDIHKKCTEETERLQSHNEPGKLRRLKGIDVTTYSFIDEEACGYDEPSDEQLSAQYEWTDAMRKEIRKELKKDDKAATLPLPSLVSKKVWVTIEGDDLKIAAEYVIKKYNKNMRKIAESKVEEKKTFENQTAPSNVSEISDEYLDEIINLVTALERLHLFYDANGRTFCTVLLNRELVKSGHSPVILDNPNMFDGCCPGTIKEKIKEGMLRFAKIKNGEIPDNYVKTKDVVERFRAEKDQYYYYNPLKVLTMRSLWLRQLVTHLKLDETTKAIELIDTLSKQLLMPPVILPENGDMAAIESQRIIFSEEDKRFFEKFDNLLKNMREQASAEVQVPQTLEYPDSPSQKKQSKPT